MNRSKVVALVLLGLGTAFFLLFTVGEVAGGDPSGLQHLPPALFLGALLLLAWRRPRAAGLTLLVVAVPLGVLYVVLLAVRDLPPAWALTVVLPPLLTGWLLVRAGRS